MLTHVLGQRLDINRGSQKPMHQNICVSSDRGGEVGIQPSSQSVVIELFQVIIGTAEIGGFIHTSGCENSHQLVEELVSRSIKFIQTIGQILGSLEVQLETLAFKDSFELFQLLELRWSMVSKNTDRWESLHYFLGYSDVRQQHKLLDQGIGLE